MLDAVISLQFNTVETIWRHFWRSANNNEAVDVGMEEDPEKILPKYVEAKDLLGRILPSLLRDDGQLFFLTHSKEIGQCDLSSLFSLIQG